jgi:YVTN family beta-propeller protein
MRSTEAILALAVLAAVLALVTPEAVFADAVRGATESNAGAGALVPGPPANVCPWAYCPIEGAPSKAAPVSAPARQLEFPGFSILPPKGKGWRVSSVQEALHSGFFDVLFSKAIGPAEFVHAYAVGHHTTTRFASPAQILGSAIDAFIKPGSQSLKTFNDTLGGASCIRWEKMREAGTTSLAAKRMQKMTLVLWQRGYLCSHPDAPAYVVEVGYFETVPKGTRIWLVPEEMQSFFKAFTLTPLGVKVSQFSVGQQFHGVVLGDEALWVTGEEAGTVSRVDPKTGAIVAKIFVGKRPEGLAFGLGAVWIPNWTSDTVSRIDPKTNAVAATIPVGRGPLDVAVSQDSVWVANEKDRSVSRIDPATNQVTATIHTDGRPVAMAAGAEAVWVENFGTDEIWRIDPKRNQAVATIRVGQGRHFIAPDHDAVWVSNSKDNSVSRVNSATNQVVAIIPVGHRPMGLAMAGGALWVANFGDATVLRIDPRTNQIKGGPIPVGQNPFFLSTSGRTIWELSLWGQMLGENSTLSRIDF